MPARSKLQERKAREAAVETNLRMQLAAHKPAQGEAPDPVAYARGLATIHAEFVFRDPASFKRPTCHDGA